MRFYLRKEVYFEIEIENVADRAIATKALNEVVEPAFNSLIEKIRIDKEERDTLKKLLGQNVNIRLLSKVDFLKVSNQNNFLKQ